MFVQVRVLPALRGGKIEEVNMRNMVDVSGGRMTLKEVEREVFNCMYIWKPSRLIVDIKRKKGGYWTTLWIPKEEFNRR